MVVHSSRQIDRTKESEIGWMEKDGFQLDWERERVREYFSSGRMNDVALRGKYLHSRLDTLSTRPQHPPLREAPQCTYYLTNSSK